MDNYHITKTDKLWTLVKEGVQRASKTAPTFPANSLFQHGLSNGEWTAWTRLIRR